MAAGKRLGTKSSRGARQMQASFWNLLWSFNIFVKSSMCKFTSLFYFFLCGKRFKNDLKSKVGIGNDYKGLSFVNSFSSIFYLII